MAKITVSRLFEISKYLATSSGQELQGALQYLSEFAEVTLRNLRNGLSLRDNINCQIAHIQLVDSTESLIKISNNQRAIAILPLQVVDQTYYVVNRFGWKYNNAGQPVVFASFLSTAGVSPPASTFVSIALVILFG